VVWWLVVVGVRMERDKGKLMPPRMDGGQGLTDTYSTILNPASLDPLSHLPIVLPLARFLAPKKSKDARSSAAAAAHNSALDARCPRPAHALGTASHGLQHLFSAAPWTYHHSRRRPD
jgi:hypothetical protein